MSETIVERLSGPLVPVMPAFDENEDLDIASTVRWVNWLIENGIRLLWTTYGTSSYFSLTDAEIYELNHQLALVTKGRAVFIAATPTHWPVKKCLDFIDNCNKWGADIVKIEPHYLEGPGDESLFEYHKAIADCSSLPLFSYTVTAGSSSSGMSSGLFERVLELQRFVGMKNDSGDFYEHVRYLSVVKKHRPEFVVVTGGSMQSFLHGYMFGAKAFASSLGMIAPRVPIDFYNHLKKGDFGRAVEIVTGYEHGILWRFNEIGTEGIRLHPCCHTALKLMGLFASNRIRFPFRTNDDSQSRCVEKILREFPLIFET